VDVDPMSEAVMDIDKAVLWFTTAFLDKPMAGWTVDWDHIDHTTPPPPPLEPGATIFDREAWCACEYMAGILVKHVASGRVWRLTGVSEGNHPNEEMEGRWPD
jgi:hypothetical protein